MCHLEADEAGAALPDVGEESERQVLVLHVGPGQLRPDVAQLRQTHAQKRQTGLVLLLQGDLLGRGLPSHLGSGGIGQGLPQSGSRCLFAASPNTGVGLSSAHDGG